jgi:hypothetical protein
MMSESKSINFAMTPASTYKKHQLKALYTEFKEKKNNEKELMEISP